jgi:hypothetical protein
MTHTTLRIADLGVALLARDEAFALEPAALPFVDSACLPTLAMDAAWGAIDPAPPGALTFDSGSLWRLYRDGSERIYRFAVKDVIYKEARVREDLAAGSIRLARAAHPGGESVYPLQYPLDELLVSALLGRGRGIEIHGCGLADADGTGRLFVGVSGAGKSTTARLWRDAGCRTILSDDRIIVRPYGGGFAMYGTPWHGEGCFASPARVRLDRIYFLRHGPANRRVPLAGAGAAARLFRCSFTPLFDEKAIAFSLEFLARLVAAVPCEEFAFVPTPAAVGALLED